MTANKKAPQSWPRLGRLFPSLLEGQFKVITVSLLSRICGNLATRERRQNR